MFNPSVADKNKWIIKTKKAMGIDMTRFEGIPVGYAIALFDPFAKDEDEVWKFALRTAHSPHHMDPEQVERLEAALTYIMQGVNKIFSVDMEELRKMMDPEDKDNIEAYISRGSLN